MQDIGSSSNTWDQVWNGAFGDAGYSHATSRDKKVLEKIGLFIQMGLHFAPDERVLEAGCGDAKLAAELRRLFGVDAYGIDFSEAAVRSAQHQCEAAGVRVNLEVADVVETSFRDEFFDKIISLGVVEHLADPKLALLEKFRTLKGGGMLILMTPNKRSFGRLDRRIQQALGKWQFGFQDEFTTEELQAMCTRIGFEIVQNHVEPRRSSSTNNRFLRTISLVDDVLRLFSSRWGFYSYVVAVKPAEGTAQNA